MKRTLTEAALNLPQGTDILAWMRAMEEAARAHLAAGMPPAAPNSMGRYPEVYISLVELTTDLVALRVVVYTEDVEISLVAANYTLSGLTPSFGPFRPVSYKLTLVDEQQSEEPEEPEEPEGAEEAVQEGEPSLRDRFNRLSRDGKNGEARLLLGTLFP